MDDTKIIYHIDDEETPYLVKVPTVHDKVTLGDFKNALNRPNYKFFFKSLDADFGVVKEEITEDDVVLPCFNGKVISWLVSADGSAKSDSHSTATDGHGSSHMSSQLKNNNSSNKSNNDHGNRPIEVLNEQEHAVGTTGHTLDECDTCAETESVYSCDRVPPLRKFTAFRHGSRHQRHGQRMPAYETSSSLMSSDVDSTSFFDSEDESSRFSTATGTTLSSVKYARHRKQRRRHKLLPIRRISEDASSFSSMTDSTMSLNVITVTLNMEKVSYLGISIVGQSNKTGDGGIYVGSVMRGGAVALDGRIEPGDMILEVNRISFEELSNDEAVRVLREEVQKPGPITLVVAKCWDPTPKDYFAIPRQEPVRPIDPRAWVLHTNAMTGAMGGGPAASGSPSFGIGSPPSGMDLIPNGYPGCQMPTIPPIGFAPPIMLPISSNMTSKSLPEVADPNDPNSLLKDARGCRSGGPGSSGGGAAIGSAKNTGSRSGDLVADPCAATGLLSINSLSVHVDMALVVHCMLLPDSGLEIHDRTWLKITIPNAFIGSDLVDWLYAHVDGFADRKEARRYANEMLKSGYIRHTVNKATFSEQCYYIFGDISTTLAHLNLDEFDSVSEIGGPVIGRGLHNSLLSPLPYQSSPHQTQDGVPISHLPNNPVFGLYPPLSSAPTTNNDLSMTAPHYPCRKMMYTQMPNPVVIGFGDDLNTVFNPSQNKMAGTSSGTDGVTSGHVFYPPMHNVDPPTVHDAQGHAPFRSNQQCVGSSSSSSSNSSRSSASSGSSSSVSSTNQPNTKRKVSNPNGSTLPAEAGVNSTSGFLRNAPPSVQSASGASSASSASRQNGTGASATGSGSTGVGRSNQFAAGDHRNLVNDHKYRPDTSRINGTEISPISATTLNSPNAPISNQRI